MADRPCPSCGAASIPESPPTRDRVRNEIDALVQARGEVKRLRGALATETQNANTYAHEVERLTSENALQARLIEDWETRGVANLRERGELKARAESAEAETVRRIAIYLRRLGEPGFDRLAEYIEQGDWNEES